MAIPYTYWPADEGGYIGYWNDYPDYLTEGDTLDELKSMLRDLRAGIRAMVSTGENHPASAKATFCDSAPRPVLQCP